MIRNEHPVTAWCPTTTYGFTTRRAHDRAPHSESATSCRAALRLVVASLAMLVGSATASAQPLPLPKVDASASARTGPIVRKVAIDQKLGAQLPLDLEFVDEGGRTVKLADYFGKGKPVALTLVYYKCPSLCNQVLNGVTGAMKAIDFTVGKEFDMLSVSIDPTETPELALQKKASYLSLYGRPESENGWHFLTGNQASITALADAVGFRYAYDEQTGQYAHGATVMIITPDGKLSHYLFGLEYSPISTRLALREASGGKIGSLTDALMQLCYQYSPTDGKYGFEIMLALRSLGVVTAGGLLAAIAFWLYREHRRRGHEPAPAV